MFIGRSVKILEDNKRKEVYSDNEENRRVIISIFYPVDGEWKPEEQAYYKDLYSPCEEEFINRFKDYLNISEEYLNNIKINTYDDVPLIKEDKKYPLIIFSPGLGMGRDTSMFNIEMLVKSGYIVITVGHLYDTEFTILPHGEIIEQEKNIPKYTYEEKKQLINMRKEDVLFVLDELDSLDIQGEVLENLIDLNRIGAIGHSIGGATQFEVCNADNRIKALVMLDGSMQYLDLSEEIKSGKKLNTPLLNFRKGYIKYEERMKRSIELYKNELNEELFKKRIVGEHEVTIQQERGQAQLRKYVGNNKSFIKLKNSEHMTFTDWYIIKNQLEEENMIPVIKAHKIINEVVIEFFNQYLCGKDGEYDGLIKSNKYEEICEI
ncbi:alpha/beta hydrolase family protein [Oceanirhabdus sp. W0125-5]|uniref:alpha/beta hydrolase family protein n=1 Tax=Oceanirhabdus sp. W0125-5 TaxID=2999116 RepID=UPI0022F314B3|nr:hypothetical protein [Oceanirhabdus sp. W0125-5]WBW96414.1 hypothetical protein OW730_22370 [Oceanirhabdus sp. W0125-5]